METTLRSYESKTHASLSSSRRNRQRRARRSSSKRRDQLVKNNNKKKMTNNEEEDELLEKKIWVLKMILPGGESIDGIDELFQETAHYILDLQSQIQAMKILSSFLQGMDKEKRKFGG
ncbi:transcription factor PAR1 [Mercurialis annua]|uniref:transcription factor PAR1 n=1 Tax=Mercurialis annua TaxID=3986 RepID=UPI00215EA8C5|nr:transcription factor PAR1 [Mercurialis annua]